MATSITLKTIFQAIDKTSGPAKAMARSMVSFGQKATVALSKAERGVRKLLSPMSKLTKKFGGIAAIAGGLTLGMAVTQGAAAFVDLDKNISAASAKFGVFDRDADVFVKIRKKAIEMGATTEFTSGQAAEGLKNLATAGFTADQAITGLKTVLDLATATQSELGTASNVAAKSLAAFGLKSDDPKQLDINLRRVSDTLNKLITSSGYGNLDEILTTMGASGASAKAAGLSIETWAAAVGTGVTNAIDASSAGSQLNMALTKMAKPSAEGAALMKKLGIQVADADGNYRDFFDILSDVEKGTKDMGTKTRAAALSTIFGARSQKLINIMIGEGSDVMKAYRKQIEDADGVTEKMSGFMRKGLAGAIAAMKSAFEAVAITIGDTFQPEIDAVIKKLTDIARGSGVWLAKNKGLLKTILKIGKALVLYFAGLKALQLILGTMKLAMAAYNIVLGVTLAFQKAAPIALKANVVAMKAYTAAQWLMNAAMTANPIGLIIVGIAALIVGIILLVKHWDVVSAKMKQWRESAGFQILSLVFPLLKLIDMIAYFGERWKAIKETFKTQGFVEGIKAIGKTLLSFVLKPLEVILKAISKIPKIGDRVAPALAQLQSFQASLDEGLLPEEATGENEKAVNLAATKNTIETKRIEDIQQQNLAIELSNKSDQDLKVTQNPALIPILTKTW